MGGTREGAMLRWRSHVKMTTAERLAQVSEWRRKHPKKTRTYGKNWAKRNPERFKANWQRRQKKYKAKQEEFLASLAGRPRPKHCELCGGQKKISFDHCHATGKFRGWICATCNLVLGQLRDDAGLFRKMADYIETGGVGYGAAKEEPSRIIQLARPAI